MAKVILGFTLSLDGFAEDINHSVGPLYPDLETLDNTEMMKESIRNTGAVVMAWKEFAMAGDPDWYVGNYEYQAPIFVVTDRMPQKPPRETSELTFTFVTDGFESAIRQARKAAGERDVSIIGSAATTQSCLRPGVVDELDIGIIPVLLHNGFRPFDGLDAAAIRLERTRVVELPFGRTHIRFLVTQV